MTSDLPVLRGEVAERYRLKEPIGKGGMGEVYRGVHTELEREVAIKAITSRVDASESMVTRFVNEARAVNMIRHENIVDVTDIFRDDSGRVFLVMELLEGRTLSKAIEDGAPFAESRVAAIGCQIADALAAAHKLDIVHRDLKPDNVYLCQRRNNPDYVKILDFGIARLRSENPEQNVTETGAIVGTPRYMSPEQAEGDEVTAASDIYCLGILLYEMVCGTAPFEATSALRIMMAHIKEPPRPIKADVSAEMRGLIEACLEKKAAQRPESMRELSRRLESLVGARYDIEAGSGSKVAPETGRNAEPTGKDGATGPTLLQSLERDEEWAESDQRRKQRSMSGTRSRLAFGVVAISAVLLLSYWAFPRTEEGAERETTVKSAPATNSAARVGLGLVLKEVGVAQPPPVCQTQDEQVMRAIATLARATRGRRLGAKPYFAPHQTDALRALESSLGPEASAWLSRVYLVQGRASDAIKPALRASKECPSWAFPYTLEASAYAYLGSLNEAIETFEIALGLDPANHDARFNLAISLLGQGDGEGAIRQLDELQSRGAQLPGQPRVRGQALLLLNEFKSASELLEQFLGSHPTDAGAWKALGSAYSGLGKLRDSERAFCRAVELGAMAPCPESPRESL